MFVAIGFFSPYPMATNLVGSMPFFTKYAFTDLALASDKV
jgi:hypothetical protein